MYEYILYSVLGLSMVTGLYFLFKYVNRKYNIHKDYKNTLNGEEIKLKEDLSELRKQILLSDSPEKRNELISKIEILTKRYEYDDK
jgi:predicted membrane protein